MCWEAFPGRHHLGGVGDAGSGAVGGSSTAGRRTRGGEALLLLLLLSL
jgi:hypothetical protein